ncbi:MAG: hypothetical protein HRT47_01500 [Candidatus Caenarcaniphilales bacterium]|nr:hypothetical protein [Candidatus Caenarcaniphilales bacterium]
MRFLFTLILLFSTFNVASALNKRQAKNIIGTWNIPTTEVQPTQLQITSVNKFFVTLNASSLADPDNIVPVTNGIVGYVSGSKIYFNVPFLDGSQMIEMWFNKRGTAATVSSIASLNSTCSDTSTEGLFECQFPVDPIAEPVFDNVDVKKL